MKNILLILLVLFAIHANGQFIPDGFELGTSGAAEFQRVDTVKGIVIYPSKSRKNRWLSYYDAIKIDSVFVRTSVIPRAHCSDPGCLVASVGYERVEDKRTVKIVFDCADRGKCSEVDLKKNYTFIPESEMQE